MKSPLTSALCLIILGVVSTITTLTFIMVVVEPRAVPNHLWGCLSISLIIWGIGVINITSYMRDELADEWEDIIKDSYKPKGRKSYD